MLEQPTMERFLTSSASADCFKPRSNYNIGERQSYFSGSHRNQVENQS